jgi:hypothetical protein
LEVKMCNLDRVAGLLISASVAIAAAIVLAGAATALAGSWWTSGAVTPIMISIAALSAFAMSSVSGAAIEAAKCAVGPCKEAADKLLAALYALAASLGALTAASVVAAFAGAIPYVGVGVSIAIGVSATIAGIALFAVSTVFLPQLDECRTRSAASPPSALVGFQKGFGGIVGFALAATGAYVGVKPF